MCFGLVTTFFAPIKQQIQIEFQEEYHYECGTAAYPELFHRTL